MERSIGVTLLTGFLGSGKTTLLNRLLLRYPLTAVVMNEFGEVGLDQQLLGDRKGPTALLAGGCVCCQVHGDLGPTFKNLYMSREVGKLPPFERVIIETTGIADPAPILETLLKDRWIAPRYRVEGVLTTVDAVFGPQQLNDHFEAVRQVAVADHLLLTKTDLVGAVGFDALRERLDALNPGASMHVIPQGEIEGSLIDRLLADAARENAARVVPAAGSGEPRFVSAPRLAMRPSGHLDTHDARFRSFALKFDQPLNGQRLADALDLLAERFGKHLLRMKAIINLAGRDHPFVLHGVQHLFHPPTELPDWPDDDRQSRFVFITVDMGAAEVEAAIRDFGRVAAG